MNYQKHYDNLMRTRKEQCSFGNLEYWEEHHIIPRSLGGTNEVSNRVMLTPREHYIAHWLLWKATNDKRLGFAFSMMSGMKDKRRLTMVQYERIRISSLGLRKGMKNSESTRRKISDALKGKQRSIETTEKIIAKTKGMKRTEEQRKRMSDAAKGRKASEETRLKMSESRKANITEEWKRELAERMKGNTNTLGLRHSKETRQKMSDSHKKVVPNV